MLDISQGEIDLATINCGVVSGNRFCSRDEVIDDSLRLSSALCSLGGKPDDRIALLMRNDIEFITVSLAASTLGMHAVPINWHFKPEEVKYILDDSNPVAIFAHSDLCNSTLSKLNVSIPVFYVKTPDHIKKAFSLDDDHEKLINGIDLKEWISRFEKYNGKITTSRHSMIYTSGTTGRPKGVKRAAFNEAQLEGLRKINKEVLGITKYMRTIIPAPMYHSAPNIYGLSAFKNHGLVVLSPRFDPVELLENIQKFKITHLQLVPSMMVKIVKMKDEVKKKYDLSSLKHVVHAAAPISIEVKKAFIELVGPCVYEYYGSTETGAVSFCNTREWLLKPGTVGKAVDGCEILIMGDNNEVLGPMQKGEIFVKNNHYPDFTYHNDDQKRKEIEYKGFITAGDVGYLDADGYLFLCDRKKDMIISGGVNIYSAEIESVILSVSEIKDCAVIGLPDEYLGEKVSLVIEVDKSAELELIYEKLRATFKEKLANYKIPKIILFCYDLLRDENGKVSKKKIKTEIMSRFTANELDEGIIWDPIVFI